MKEGAPDVLRGAHVNFLLKQHRGSRAQQVRHSKSPKINQLPNMEDIAASPDLQKFAPPKFETPQNAEVFKDIQYSTQPGHVRQRLDLYLPKPENRRANRAKIPLIVYIHGKQVESAPFCDTSFIANP